MLGVYIKKIIIYTEKSIKKRVKERRSKHVYGKYFVLLFISNQG